MASQKKYIALLSLVVFFAQPFLLQANSATGAGKVLFVSGDGRIIDSNSNERALHRGAEVNPGDEVVTDSGSRAQLRMQDGSFFSLRPNTQFKIHDYRYDNSDQDTSIFGLIRGGFRAITGLIGKKDRSAYKVNTPIATIGIRGTHYTAMLCQQGDCSEAGSMNDGLYLGVVEGGVTLINEAGVLNIDTQQFGYVQDVITVPSMIPTLPAGFVVEAVRPARTASRDQAADSNEPTAETAADKELVPEDVVEDKRPRQVVDTEVADSSDAAAPSIKTSEAILNDGSLIRLDDKTVSSEISDTSIGSKAPIAVAELSVGVSSISDAKILINSSTRQLTEFTIDDGVKTSTDLDIIGTGYDEKTGLSWGRWKNPSDGDTSLDLTAFHWAVGPPVSMPITGNAEYSVVGGTSPTDQDGNLGVFGNANLSADFTNNQITKVEILVGMDSNVWGATRTTPTSIQDASFGAAFTDMKIIDINDRTSIVTGSGSFSGAFTGSGASGAVLTYTMQGTPANTSVDTTLNGSVTLSR